MNDESEKINVDGVCVCVCVQRPQLVARHAHNGSILFHIFFCATRTTEWIKSRAIRLLSAFCSIRETINCVRTSQSIAYTTTSKMQALVNREN